MKTWCLLLLATLAWFGCAPDARAAESCTVSATGVAFGAYDPRTGAPLNALGSMTVVCQGNEIPVTITLTTGSSNTYANRTMRNGAEVMSYNLYLDAARTIVFGNGTGGSQSSTCITGRATSGIGCTGSNPGGLGRQFVRPIHGQIPGSQDVGGGTYSDTIFYTVTF